MKKKKPFRQVQKSYYDPARNPRPRKIIGEVVNKNPTPGRPAPARTQQGRGG